MPVAHDANAAYSDSPSDAKATPSVLIRTLPSWYGRSGRDPRPGGAGPAGGPQPALDRPPARGFPPPPSGYQQPVTAGFQQAATTGFQQAATTGSQRAATAG